MRNSHSRAKSAADASTVPTERGHRHANSTTATLKTRSRSRTKSAMGTSTVPTDKCRKHSNPTTATSTTMKNSRAHSKSATGNTTVPTDKCRKHSNSTTAMSTTMKNSHAHAKPAMDNTVPTDECRKHSKHFEPKTRSQSRQNRIDEAFFSIATEWMRCSLPCEMPVCNGKITVDDDEGIEAASEFVGSDNSMANSNTTGNDKNPSAHSSLADSKTIDSNVRSVSHDRQHCASALGDERQGREDSTSRRSDQLTQREGISKEDGHPSEVKSTNRSHYDDRSLNVGSRLKLNMGPRKRRSQFRRRQPQKVTLQQRRNRQMQMKNDVALKGDTLANRRGGEECNSKGRNSDHYTPLPTYKNSSLSPKKPIEEGEDVGDIHKRMAHIINATHIYLDGQSQEGESRRLFKKSRKPMKARLIKKGKKGSRVQKDVKDEKRKKMEEINGRLEELAKDAQLECVREMRKEAEALLEQTKMSKKPASKGVLKKGKHNMKKNEKVKDRRHRSDHSLNRKAAQDFMGKSTQSKPVGETKEAKRDGKDEKATFSRDCTTRSRTRAESQALAEIKQSRQALAEMRRSRQACKIDEKVNPGRRSKHSSTSGRQATRQRAETNMETVRRDIGNPLCEI